MPPPAPVDLRVKPLTADEWLLVAKASDGTVLGMKALAHRALLLVPPPAPDPDWPESEEFFNLMQTYRHAPINRPTETRQAYEAVKAYLRAASPAVKGARPAPEPDHD